MEFSSPTNNIIPKNTKFKKMSKTEAILIASKWNLQNEVIDLIDNQDYDPVSALTEWDLI